MPTFLHTADVHLDSAFTAHFDARQAEMRRRELLRCMSDMIERAKGLDLLLIAGDLFDSSAVSSETIAFLKRKFSEISDTHIFICAGNHDPYTAESVYAKENFGDNVHVFSTEAECVELPELKTRVYGASFSSSFCDEPIDIPKIEKRSGVTDILVIHADLSSRGGSSRYNMIDKNFLENCGADYVALGHIHKRSEVLRAGSTYYAYPGAPEGRGFDECGDMGCYVGSADCGSVRVEFERHCIRRMFRVDADISGAGDSLSAAASALEAIKSVGSESDIYKLTLCGRIAAGAVSAEAVRDELMRSVHYIEVRDDTRADYNIDELLQQNTLCGEFVRTMQRRIEAMSAEEKAVAEDAMLLGIEVLLGGDA